MYFYVLFIIRIISIILYTYYVIKIFFIKSLHISRLLNYYYYFFKFRLFHLDIQGTPLYNHTYKFRDTHLLPTKPSLGKSFYVIIN